MEKKNEKKMELKTPKGTKDYGPFEMAIREKVFNTITSVFKRHGGVTIDTPVFELKEVLTGKYGEDSKLIYDLQDQGGELCSLRYDLTVPFARFLAMNRDIKQIKRYQIAKVYRRDQPAMTKGRFREFYQCDFDIAGVYEPLVPDGEILKIMSEILTELDIGEYIIKINDRKLLDGIFEVAGVPVEKFRPISSSVDKLDKVSWEEVKKEMVLEKGLEADIADKIGSYVKLKGGKDLLQTLLNDSLLMNNERAKQGISDMQKLFTFLECFGILDKVSFDLSLARGLDYYTGLIMEAVLVGADVGSISGGGRYDELVGMFSPKNQIPCVGFSVGVERIFSILEAKAMEASSKVKVIDVQAFVAVTGGEFMEDRMKIASSLWKAKINAEFSYKRKPKYLDQCNYCEKNMIPVMIVVAPDELAAGKVIIKNGMNSEDRGTLIAINDIVVEVQARINGQNLSNLALKQ